VTLTSSVEAVQLTLTWVVAVAVAVAADGVDGGVVSGAAGVIVE
jgi:hypothetical protein